MNVEIVSNGGLMLALLSGELDHHSAAGARMTIDCAVDAKCPCELYLDFSKVTFMDSSGVGLVMGRYRLLHEYGGTLYIANCRGSIRKVMQVSGMSKLARFVDGDIRARLFSQQAKGEENDEKIRQDVK